MIDDNQKDDTDELDDLDNFDLDEDWDEMDLSDHDETSIDSTAIPDTNQSNEKTFIQKYFLLIVSGIVILFAGLFILGQGWLSGSSNSVPVEENAAENTSNIAENNNATLPPENSANVAADLMDLDLPIQEENNVVADDDLPLTPEPLLSQDNDDNRQLVLEDLDAVLENDPPLAENSANLITDSNVENSDLAVEDMSIDRQEENILVDDLTEDQIVDSVNDNIASNLAMDSSTEAPIVDDTVDPNSMISNIDTLKIEKEALILEKEGLNAEILEKKSEIASLKQEISLLEAKKSKSVTKIEEVAAKKPAKTQESASKPKKPALTWIMRGARPGVATISLRGSNDVKQVEVGDYVMGLGRIRSINNENGRWVIRGSDKTLSQ